MKGLDGDRSRFNGPPPSYTSHQSHNSTRSQSPCELTEKQRCWEQQQWQLRRDREASRPDQQFDTQVDEAEAHSIKKIENRALEVPDGTNLQDLARDTVKQLWMDRGIWSDEWKITPQPRWMHELSNLSPGTDTVAQHQPNIFTSSPTKPELALRRMEAGWKFQQAAARQALRKRKREGTRPLPQFISQVYEECERVHHELRDGTGSAPADVNSRAYNNVKSTWVKRGIWDHEWGILPGMSWKHERPVQVLQDDSTEVQANPPSDDVRNQAKAASIFDQNTSPRPSHQFQVEKPRRRLMRQVNATFPAQQNPTEELSKALGIESEAHKCEIDDSVDLASASVMRDPKVLSDQRRRSKRLRSKKEDAGDTDVMREFQRENLKRARATTVGGSEKRQKVVRKTRE